jgi:hypothetical protein
VRRDPIEGLQSWFDQPTRFTLDAFGILPADATGVRDPSAIVILKPIQAEYLGLEIDGGIRRAGDYATTKTGSLVLGPDAPVDAYGNLPRDDVGRVLAEPSSGHSSRVAS